MIPIPDAAAFVVPEAIVAELAEGADLNLTHPFSGHTQPATDLLERQDLPLQAEAEHQDGSLPGVELPHQSPCDGSLLFGFHQLINCLMPVHHVERQSIAYPVTITALQLEPASIECPGHKSLLGFAQSQGRRHLIEAGNPAFFPAEHRSARRHFVRRPTMCAGTRMVDVVLIKAWRIACLIQ